METTPKDALDAARVDTSTLATFWDGHAGPIYTLTVPGAEAVALWRTLRALVPQTGYWPVLLGDGRDVERVREAWGYSDAISPTETIRQGLALAPKVLLERWQAASAEIYPPGGGEAPHGEWPEEDEEADTEERFLIPYDILTGAFKDAVTLALVPTRESWEVPAFLRFGGWNDCPGPEEHVCMLKHWHEAHGAEVVGIGGDVIETWVAQPPASRDAALAVASEQYSYCPGIVDQGTETLEGLAAALLNAPIWFFWWD